MQMMKAKKYPVKELLLHVPDDFEFFIDSLCAAAYNSEEVEQYSQLEPDVYCPENSLESLEEIDFDSSSDGSVEMIPKPANRKEKVEAKAEIKKAERPKLKKETLTLHGFDVN